MNKFLVTILALSLSVGALACEGSKGSSSTVTTEEEQIKEKK